MESSFYCSLHHIIDIGTVFHQQSGASKDEAQRNFWRVFPISRVMNVSKLFNVSENHKCSCNILDVISINNYIF